MKMNYRDMRGCQGIGNPGCLLHAMRGSDLCRSCVGFPGIRRIANPVFAINGERIDRSGQTKQEKFVQPAHAHLMRHEQPELIDDDITF